MKFSHSLCPATAVFAVLVGADGGREGVGEHREGHPAQPGDVAADLVLVQAGEALVGLEVSSILQRVPATRTRAGSGTGRRVKELIDHLTGGAVAAAQ